FDVSFADPTGTYVAYYTPIRDNLLAAAHDWATLLNGQQVSIQIEIRFSSTIATGNGGSLTNNYVGTNAGGFTIWDQGVGGEIRTGYDSNGATPDAQITLGDSYLRNELWFDPDPASRS